MHKNILVFIEHHDGEISRVSLELLGKARSLADEKKEEVHALLIGDQVNRFQQELFAYGADVILIADHKDLLHYQTEPYTALFTKALKRAAYDIVMVGATAIGRDLAPRVAARVHTGLTADCTSLALDEENGDLLMTRPAFGGNIMATIVCPDHRPQMSTVRPGVMIMAQRDDQRTGEVVTLTIDKEDLQSRVTILEVAKSLKELVKIEDANVLISAGRGIGGPEFLPQLQELAEAMDGVVSASRAVVDKGWIERDFQVGQTGKTVRPDVYIACGISGAIQHVAGMEEAELIIAINKDPNAPIFDIADIGIVGDVKKVIPTLTEAVLKSKAAKKEH